ncbi:unnamed protein product [Paramecium pentaurelia]|uniref:Uncharacterized protein n=1 Tax=Paramecium pentaurelia TaxID=43138 RepID=A0A8S1U393_9CILI|nr:unnamed protein product [Paramecium pentaurelia]
MQSYLQKQDINRGQSFTFDIEGQNIYYYSIAKPLPNDIIDDLIVCSKIKKLLLFQLPKVWFIMAKTTAYLVIENQQKFVTSNFILDMFIYSWLSNDLQDLKQELLNRLNRLNIEMEKLHRLIDIFSQEMIFIQKELDQINTWEYQLNYNKNCIKPLYVFRDKSSNDNQCLIKRIDELNINDDSRNSTLTSSQISQISNHKEVERSKTDVKEITTTLLTNKMRKFSKQMEKMSENFFQELIIFNSQEQQWQIAGQFVVIIIETTVQSDFDMKTIEKVRFIQPALLFYRKAIQVWMLTKQSQFDKTQKIHSRIGKVSFSQFLCKAKCFLGQYWKETLTIPLHTFFQLAEQLYSQVENETILIKKMSTFLILFKEKLISLWEQNLSLFAKSHIQN